MNKETEILSQNAEAEAPISERFAGFVATLEWQIRKDDKLMGWNGRLEHIHITGKASGAMRSLDEARLVAGEGIEGDRYFLGTGTYSMKPELGRQVTLIEAETLEALARDEGIELLPQEHRRNLTVRGVPLNHLVGRQFRVDEVVLEGTRLNFPCKYLEMVTGKAVYAPLLNRSGLNCIIVEGGTIRPGDALTPA